MIHEHVYDYIMEFGKKHDIKLFYGVSSIFNINGETKFSLVRSIITPLQLWNHLTKEYEELDLSDPNSISKIEQAILNCK